MNMKRLFSCMAMSLVTLMTFAQDIPVGMRVEIVELADGNQDKFQYSIFQYKEENGNIGFYMSLGHKTELLSIIRDDITDTSISHTDEMCLPLGTTTEEIFDKLESMLDLLQKPNGTTVEFPCKINNGADRLGEDGKATCIVTKRFLQSKRLCFNFESGRRTARTDLTKSALKRLRLGVKMDIKLHPRKYAD